MKIDLYDLSGGQNSKASPLFIGDNECELVKNYHMDNLGSLTKRNGIANLLGQTVNNKSVTGLYSPISQVSSVGGVYSQTPLSTLNVPLSHNA